MLRVDHHVIPQPRRPGQHHRPVNGMFQLAHVAWPAVTQQMRPRAGAKHHPGQPHPQPALFAEIARQQHHVFAPFAQRRHRKREDTQAVVQVGAEVPGQHLFTQIAVGGRQHPHIDPQAAVVAHALDIAILQNAQQLGL